MQLNVYAKYNDRGEIERQETFARAVCSEDLFDIYYSGSHGTFVWSIVAATIILPIISFMIFVVSVRKASVFSFMKPDNHSQLVSLALVGAVLSLFIVITDFLACHVAASGSHEYAVEVTSWSINFSVVYATLILDLIFTFPSFLCVLYVFYINITFFFGFDTNCKCLPKNFLRSCFTAVLGKGSIKKYNKLKNKQSIVIIFPIMLVSPLLCITSHLGYVIIAWLTEPDKSTANLILYYIILVFLYKAYKKLYVVHSRIRIGLKRSNAGRNRNKVIELDVRGVESGHRSTHTSGETEESHVSSHCCGLSFTKVDKELFNTQAVCLLFFHTIIVVGMVLLILSIFILLPIASARLATYIFNALQLIIAFVSIQFALSFFSDLNIKAVLESFREVYAQKRATNSNKNIIEIAQDENIELEAATGSIAAEFTNVVIQKHLSNIE